MSYTIDHYDPETPEEEKAEHQAFNLPSLKELTTEPNIAELLPQEELLEIGHAVVSWYEEDEDSRKIWLEQKYKKGLETVLQVAKNKTWPWPKASNVKYPLLPMAALAFHARAYPSLVPTDGVVDIKVIGNDPQGTKVARAERVQMHMNYQVMEQMETWEPEMDKLLITLPVTGTEFKKTYYDAELKRNVSEHVFAKDLVVNYYAKDLETAARKTHIMEMNHNEIREKVNAGLYCDFDYGSPIPRDDATTRIIKDAHGLLDPSSNDDSIPHVILECHCWWDLDGDGYAEPYIATVHKDSKQVCRLVTRYQSKGIVMNGDKVVRITPDEYFTKYEFIPSPDGSFYGLGFIHLVGTINEAVDTLINQLIDAGTLSNLQSGFLSRSFRQRGGNLQFTPGEWKVANANGQDLKDGIFPLPVREPSNVLLSLLQMLIDSGQRITSTTDIMVGENPGQNQKATTTMAVVENGQKVFTAVYKRIRFALGQEFKKLYKLNSIYFNKEEYLKVLDIPDPGQLEDIENDYNLDDLKITPSADPNASSPAMKLKKAEMLIQLLPLGLPRGVVLKRYLQALEIENLDEFQLDQMDQQAQQPDPKTMLGMEELNLKKQVAAHDAEIADREQNRKEVETAIKEKKVNLDHHLGGQKIRADLAMGVHNNMTKMQQSEQEPSSDGE